MRVWSLGWEDPLEKEMATHFSILVWKIPWTEEPGGLQSLGSQRVRQDLSDLAQAHYSVYLEGDKGRSLGWRVHRWKYWLWMKAPNSFESSAWSLSRDSFKTELQSSNKGVWLTPTTNRVWGEMELQGSQLHLINYLYSKSQQNMPLLLELGP